MDWNLIHLFFEGKECNEKKSSFSRSTFMFNS